MKGEKYPCSSCGESYRIRAMRLSKGDYICYNCVKKKGKIIEVKGFLPFRGKTLEQALEKVYEIEGYVNMKGKVLVNISLPQIMIGHKIKLVLVDEDGEK